MTHAYGGTETRQYPAYRDASSGSTLVAEPGGSYDMEPVAGAEDLPVPPRDGLWPVPEETEAPEVAELAGEITEDKAAPPEQPQPKSKTKAAASAAKGE
jgi:hypothetical protein